MSPQMQQQMQEQMQMQEYVPRLVLPRIAEMNSPPGSYGGMSNMSTNDWEMRAVLEGSWTKTVDDVALVGTLSIIELADDTWDMRFRFVRQNGGAAPVNVPAAFINRSIGVP